MGGKNFNIVILIVGVIIGFFLGLIVSSSLNWPGKATSSSASLLNLPEGHPQILLPDNHPRIEQSLPEGHPPIDSLPDPASGEKQVQTLEAKAKAEPKNVDVRIQLGDLCLDTNRFEKAVIWYNQALELEPKEVDVWTNLAVAHFRLNQSDKAIADLEKALSYHPTFPLALLYLGAVKRDANDKKGAIEAWEKLIRTNPNFQGIEKVKEQVAALKAQ